MLYWEGDCGPSPVSLNFWSSCTTCRIQTMNSSVLFHFLCHDFLETVAKIATFHKPAVWKPCWYKQLGAMSDKLLPSPSTWSQEAWHQLPPRSSSNKVVRRTGSTPATLASSTSKSIWEILSVIHFSSFRTAMSIDKTEMNEISSHVNNSSFLKTPAFLGLT